MFILQRISMNGLGIFEASPGKGCITQLHKTPKTIPDKKIGVAQKTPKVSNIGSLGKK
jgi:hypothetical protein